MLNVHTGQECIESELTTHGLWFGREVHLYLAEVPQADGPALEKLVQRLPHDEQLRARRMVAGTAALQFVSACLLLRRTVAAYFGYSESAIRLRYGRHGRPTVESPAEISELSFSLSHTNGMVGCAFVRGGRIGIDVEWVDLRCNTLALEQSCLHPEELRLLSRYPTDLRRRAFLHLWTLKEAYGKALGVGLGVPFDKIRMVPDIDGVVRSPLDECGALRDSWALRCWRLGREHGLALASDALDRAVLVSSACPLEPAGDLQF